LCIATERTDGTGGIYTPKGGVFGRESYLQMGNNIADLLKSTRSCRIPAYQPRCGQGVAGIEDVDVAEGSMVGGTSRAGSPGSPGASR